MTTPVGVLNGNWKPGRDEVESSELSWMATQRGISLMNEYRELHGSIALLKLYEENGRDFGKLFEAIESLVARVQSEQSVSVS